jgi:hypothetical protein
LQTKAKWASVKDEVFMKKVFILPGTKGMSSAEHAKKVAEGYRMINEGVIPGEFGDTLEEVERYLARHYFIKADLKDLGFTNDNSELH